MFEQPYPTNCHFDGSTRALVDDLIERTTDAGDKHARHKRQRKSQLDGYQIDVLEKRSLKWSFERIARYLAGEYGIRKVNKSTVQRKVKRWLGGA